MATKKEITQHERLQLIGLLTLAKHHGKALEDIQDAAKEITGDDGVSGHTTDAVWDHCNVDRLLKGLGITVKEG